RYLAAVILRLDGGIELSKETDPALLAEAHDVAFGQPLRGLHEGAPARSVKPLVERCLDRRLARAAAESPSAQPGGNHLRVVDHQRIARMQQIGGMADAAIVELGRGTGTHDQEARRLPRRDGTQRATLAAHVV